MDTNMNSGNEAVIESTEPKMSIWGQIVGVFTSPSNAFEDYVKKPNIVIPLLIVIVGVVIYSLVSVPYSSQLQYDIMKTSTVLPQQALEQMRNDAANPNYVVSGIAGAVFGVLPGLVAALLAWGVGSFIFGGKSKFSTVWGVAIMGGLIGTVGNLVKLPLMMAKNSALVSIGPAALMPEGSPTSFLFLVLLFLDVFIIWGIYVTGLGYAKAMKISNSGGIWTSVIIAFLFIFLFAGLQTIGMKFAGVETTWL